MKKEKRSVAVKLITIISKVLDGSCFFPAGKSEYCSYVMALLLELADYSLSQFKSVPEEIACTSRLRQWGVPGETMQKAPVMETTVQKQPSSKGITSTLYDPRKVDDRAINWEKINLLKERLTERNNKTPFVTCVPPKCDGKKVNTRYGMFQIGSPLSFHLNPVGFTTNIITNIPELSMSPFTTHELPKLPLSFISEEHDVVPKNWVLTEDERAFLATIKFTEQNSYVLEEETVMQSLCELWKNRKN